jgi:hypothetical protein
MAPQNTGVTEFDYNADRIIGEDSRKKWSVIEERNAEKERVLAQAKGVQSRDLSREADGSYRVMSKQERVAVETAREIDRLATEHTKKEVK